MRVTVNGEARDFVSGISVAGLIEVLDLDPRRLGIERNRQIVPKSSYQQTVLADNDRIEIVHFVGGG